MVIAGTTLNLYIVAHFVLSSQKNFVLFLLCWKDC